MPFGKQHRDRSRREAKAQVEAVTKAFFVKPDSGCVEFPHQVDLEDPDFRLDQRLVVHGEKLVEFAVILSRKRGGQWVEMYSIDTEHGTLHEHISGHSRDGDAREIYPLYTQVEVQESLDDPATRMVLEKYRRMRD